LKLEKADFIDGGYRSIDRVNNQERVAIARSSIAIAIESILKVIDVDEHGRGESGRGTCAFRSGRYSEVPYDFTSVEPE
jgi:hypothetical protein